VNINLLKTTKKPKILSNSRNKMNLNERIMTPDKKSCVMGINSVSPSRRLFVDNVSTQPFWNSNTFFNKYTNKHVNK
jgi:hypothetical protein